MRDPRYFMERTSGSTYGVFDRLRTYGSGASGCICTIEAPELAQIFVDVLNRDDEEKRRKSGAPLGFGSFES